MFVEECRKAAEDYPDVEVDDVIVDTFAMRLVRDPQTFDVVVTTNMFGDILTDEAAGLVGGLGMAPGLCIGDGNIAMAQATHGSAPDIAGKGIANPYAMIESTRMLFDWLGRVATCRKRCAAAAAMERAIDAGSVRPGDPHPRHPRSGEHRRDDPGHRRDRARRGCACARIGSRSSAGDGIGSGGDRGRLPRSRSARRSRRRFPVRPAPLRLGLATTTAATAT